MTDHLVLENDGDFFSFTCILPYSNALNYIHQHLAYLQHHERYDETQVEQNLRMLRYLSYHLIHHVIRNLQILPENIQKICQRIFAAEQEASTKETSDAQQEEAIKKLAVFIFDNLIFQKLINEVPTEQGKLNAKYLVEMLSQIINDDVAGELQQYEQTREMVAVCQISLRLGMSFLAEGGFLTSPHPTQFAAQQPIEDHLEIIGYPREMWQAEFNSREAVGPDHSSITEVISIVLTNKLTEQSVYLGFQDIGSFGLASPAGFTIRDSLSQAPTLSPILSISDTNAVTAHVTNIRFQDLPSENIMYDEEADIGDLSIDEISIPASKCVLPWITEMMSGLQSRTPTTLLLVGFLDQLNSDFVVVEHLLQKLRDDKPNHPHRFILEKFIAASHYFSECELLRQSAQRKRDNKSFAVFFVLSIAVAGITTYLATQAKQNAENSTIDFSPVTRDFLTSIQLKAIDATNKIYTLLKDAVQNTLPFSLIANFSVLLAQTLYAKYFSRAPIDKSPMMLSCLALDEQTVFYNLLKTLACLDGSVSEKILETLGATPDEMHFFGKFRVAFLSLDNYKKVMPKLQRKKELGKSLEPTQIQLLETLSGTLSSEENSRSWENSFALWLLNLSVIVALCSYYLYQLRYDINENHNFTQNEIETSLPIQLDTINLTFSIEAMIDHYLDLLTVAGFYLLGEKIMRLIGMGIDAVLSTRAAQMNQAVLAPNPTGNNSVGEVESTETVTAKSPGRVASLLGTLGIYRRKPQATVGDQGLSERLLPAPVPARNVQG